MPGFWKEAERYFFRAWCNLWTLAFTIRYLKTLGTHCHIATLNQLKETIEVTKSGYLIEVIKMVTVLLLVEVEDPLRQILLKIFLNIGALQLGKLFASKISQQGMATMNEPQFFSQLKCEVCIHQFRKFYMHQTH